ncbi:MAG TPA: tetratricopeptide repeat protein [Rhodothermales bacterium]|nr:tetratricopeptide repeat protein [Rhodothermales bacterium]
MRRLALLLVSLLVAGLAALPLSGCASADEVYNRGQELELAGRLDEAFDYYARALTREPGMQKARGRLRVVGRTLVEGHLARAAGAAAPPTAADAWLDADDVARRAAEAGESLDLPVSFVVDRDAALDAAARWLADEAEGAVDAGRWSDALAHREHAARYGPAPDVAARLEGAALDAYMGWAEEDRAAGRYRAAYDHLAGALGILSPSDPRAADMAARQSAIEEEGALRAVPLPLAEDGDRPPLGTPRDFARDVDDALADAHWERPPVFIRTPDVDEVAREIRRARRAPDYDRLTDVAAFTRTFGGDFAVVTRLTAFRRTATERDRDSVSVPLRRGGTARYLRIEEEVTLRAEATVTAVRAADAQAACRETASADFSRRVIRGEYAGRVADLDLPSRDRDLFDEDARDDAEVEAALDLADRFAASVAERAYGCLTAQVR